MDTTYNSNDNQPDRTFNAGINQPTQWTTTTDDSMLDYLDTQVQSTRDELEN